MPVQIPTQPMATTVSTRGPQQIFSDSSLTSAAGQRSGADNPISDGVRHAGHMARFPVRDEVRQATEGVWNEYGSGRPYDDFEQHPLTWQLLPDGLLFQSYMAGEKEPRFKSSWVYASGDQWFWDIALGGRVGIVRLGSADRVQPQGWQLDMEGAAFPRLDPENDRDMVSADFRFGVPLTWRSGAHSAKFGYYHLSAHVGDEWWIRNPTFVRRNYSRDALLAAYAVNVTDQIRVYAEVAWAFVADGGAEPWELQFGGEWIPPYFNGISGAPFAAINGHLRQEVDWGGSVNVLAGWRWVGRGNHHVFRAGLQYYNGKTQHFEFLNESEQLTGLGLWYDY